MDFPIPPESWWSTDILSSSNFLQGVDQQILPCGQGRIDSVKINPSLLMMREWLLSSLLPCDLEVPSLSNVSPALIIEGGLNLINSLGIPLGRACAA